jgi:hypothetical protein
LFGSLALGARLSASVRQEEEQARAALSLGAAHQPLAASPPLGAKASTTLGLARLLVEFAHANLFLNPAPLDQLPKSPDRFLGGLFIPQSQLNHAESPFVLITVGLTSPLATARGTYQDIIGPAAGPGEVGAVAAQLIERGLVSALGCLAIVASRDAELGVNRTTGYFSSK